MMHNNLPINLTQKLARDVLVGEIKHREKYGSVNSIKKLESTPKDLKSVFFISDTKFGALKKATLYCHAIYGVRIKDKKNTRGNKRLGVRQYYADLLNCFLELKEMGITLPKNVLSHKACNSSLITTLKKHGKIPKELVNRSKFNSQDREKIRKSNESGFNRVISVLK